MPPDEMKERIVSPPQPAAPPESEMCPRCGNVLKLLEGQLYCCSPFCVQKPMPRGSVDPQAARIRELEAIAERMESAIQTADGSHCSYCREYLHPQLAAPLAEYAAYRQKHGATNARSD